MRALKRVSIILLFGAVLVAHAHVLIVGNSAGVYEKPFVLQSGDAGHYLTIAENIRLTGVFSDDYSSLPTESATWRPPVFPFLLSGGLFLTDDPLVLVLFKKLVEVLILGIAVFLLFQNGILSIDKALLAFVLLGEPHFVKYSSVLLTESLTAVLLMLFLSLVAVFLKTDRGFYFIPLIGAVVVLTHPITLIFVVLTCGALALLSLRRMPFKTFLFIGIFALLMLSWPIRNQLVFDQGLFITASQGSSLAKGWNPTVASEYTNTDGDLADERQVLAFATNEEILATEGSVIGRSRLYMQSASRFISRSSPRELTQIAKRKLISNFNPFPEKSKPGSLELLGTLSRIIGLLGFGLFLGLFFFKKLRRVEFLFVGIVITGIFLSQALTATLFYTGIRFNAVYAPALLGGFILLVLMAVRQSDEKTKKIAVA